MSEQEASAPIDFNGLDTAVNGPLRLGVLTALQLDGALDFTTLKNRLSAAMARLLLICVSWKRASTFNAASNSSAAGRGRHIALRRGDARR